MPSIEPALAGKVFIFASEVEGTIKPGGLRAFSVAAIIFDSTGARWELSGYSCGTYGDIAVLAALVQIDSAFDDATSFEVDYPPGSVLAKSCGPNGYAQNKWKSGLTTDGKPLEAFRDFQKLDALHTTGRVTFVSMSSTKWVDLSAEAKGQARRKREEFPRATFDVQEGNEAWGEGPVRCE